MERAEPFAEEDDIMMRPVNWGAVGAVAAVLMFGGSLMVGAYQLGSEHNARLALAQHVEDTNSATTTRIDMLRSRTNEMQQTLAATIENNNRSNSAAVGAVNELRVAIQGLTTKLDMALTQQGILPAGPPKRQPN